MATSDGTVAVKVGYSFALVPGSELGGESPSRTPGLT